MISHAESTTGFSETKRPIALEVCVDRVDDALAAIEAGATRIEMNTALDAFGLTPPAASCGWLKENCDVPIVAMLRPHNRGYVYTPEEQLECLRDCEHLLEAGVDGIVFGSLKSKSEIDLDLLAKIVELCCEREVIFHRAFDKLPDLSAALKLLTDAGVKRVLTSGGAVDASTGRDQLSALAQAGAPQIEILPAGGITSENAREIIMHTGCTQLHGSFRFGNYRNGRPDAEDIQATRKILDEIASI